jgi:8-oxo-dGTP diphosphatase
MSGAEFALRNQVGEKKGTVPKTESFISQTMSLPMRDPKTDPILKGPGIPNKPRTFLPTRGTGVVAQSGYDWKLDPELSKKENEQTREGVEGQGLEGRQDGAIKESQITDAHAVPTDDGWITMSGAHMLVGKGGKHESGPFKGQKHSPKGGGKKPEKKPEHKSHGGGESKGHGGPGLLEAVEKGAEAIHKVGEDSGVEESMKEFSKGKLKSSSGKKVTDPKQAAAIGYSQEKKDNEKRRSATIIVRDGDKFLMGPTNKDGRWTLPGGVVDDHESMHQGALRELAEETGIEANKLRYLGTRLVESEKDKPYEVAMYEHHIAKDVKPTAKKDPDKEVAEWRWLSSAEPLHQDVLGNLKHTNNVALDHMGLLK